jgi:hypothetical protein
MSKLCVLFALVLLVASARAQGDTGAEPQNPPPVTEPIAPVTEASPNSHHTHEEFQPLANKLNEVRSKDDSDQKIAQRLGAKLERSVVEAVQNNRRQVTELSRELDSLKATVEKAPDVGQVLSEYSSKADQRMSKLEKEVQTLKDFNNQLKLLGDRLEALETTAKTQDETLARLAKTSGNNNVTDLALFIDRLVKSACTFYEHTVAPLAHKAWAHAPNDSELALKHGREFIEYVIDFKTPGSTCSKHAHAVVKQKLTELGVPAEHGDVAAFASIMATVGMAALLSLIVFFRCCCGGKRSSSTTTTSPTPSTTSPTQPLPRPPLKKNSSVSPAANKDRNKGSKNGRH